MSGQARVGGQTRQGPWGERQFAAGGPGVRAVLVRSVPARRGEVIGRARVVSRPEDLNRLTDEHILVCLNLGRWLFEAIPRAGGVVAERGGVLSLGASLARKCGRPTVVQATGATRVIRDGDLIRVDANRGQVTVLNQPS